MAMMMLESELKVNYTSFKDYQKFQWQFNWGCTSPVLLCDLFLTGNSETSSSASAVGRWAALPAFRMTPVSPSGQLVPPPRPPPPIAIVTLSWSPLLEPGAVPAQLIGCTALTHL